MKLTEEQLETLCDIARAAGHEVMAVYGGDLATWQKSDNSPLTEADLRADSIIRRELERIFPGVFILSEESTSSEGGAAIETFFLVDPLDGTKEFLKRNGEFTINIALIHQGKPVAGVVFAPALDELFYAGEDFGAWKISANQRSAICSANFDYGESNLRVVGSRSHGGDRLAAWLATLSVGHNFTAAGSSLKFCRIAEGEADVYPRFGPTSQWDTAAAQCVLEVAGGCVVDLDGVPLSYGLNRPILNVEFIALGKPAMYAALFSGNA
jgi:3'(2'), 5'-bisphosphate nucleotidase